MVALVERVDHGPVGVPLTYLADDGTRKATIEPSMHSLGRYAAVPCASPPQLRRTKTISPTEIPMTKYIPTEFPRPFADSAVTPEIAAALREAAQGIREYAEQQDAAIAAIGRTLIATAERLSRDQFHLWVQREFGLAPRTACSYMAAARRYRAPKPKLASTAKLLDWNPKGSAGASGYATIQLSCGLVLHDCPVFIGTSGGSYIEPSFPSHIHFPVDVWGNEFDKVLMQIRDVDPGAFQTKPASATRRSSAQGGLGDLAEADLIESWLTGVSARPHS